MRRTPTATQVAAELCTPLTALPHACRYLPYGKEVDDPVQKALIKNAAYVGGSLYNVSLADNTVYQTGLMDSGQFGNALSPYWFGRALAKLAGMDYQMLWSSSASSNKDWFKSPYFLRCAPDTAVQSPTGKLQSR